MSNAGETSRRFLHCGRNDNALAHLPFVKLRRSLAVEEEISEKTFAPFQLHSEGCKQHIKGSFLVRFCLYKNEQTYLISYTIKN